MKKLLFCIIALLAGASTFAQYTPASQMEQLDRGLVALPASSGSGNFVSWRLFGTDDVTKTKFNLLRNGKQIKAGLTVTNYKDAGGTSSSEYQVVTLVDGVAQDTSKVAKAWDKVWLKIPLDRPAAGKTKPYTTTIDKNTVSFPDGQDYTYSPNDCSVGDVDGDGEYEIFVKWDPSNSKDNSQNGVTGNVIIDCYKLDGTKLWRIDLGKNIRAGAHYTQFQVYDYDGDGRAELMCKTAPGSIDGQGKYVNQAATDATIKAASNTKDWVSEGAGRINGGHEYLTVFRGLTGEAIHTVAYYPNRNAKAELSEAAGDFNWGGSNKNDKGSYGNRGERYLAATAYLDGPDQRPSGIFCRGYYTYAYVWAVDFDGQQLRTKWLHRSDETTKYSVVTYDANGNTSTKSFSGLKSTSGGGSATMYGNGNHNLTIGDVDGDGCDEIIWGSAALDNDGRLLYATGFGHGDAIHMGKMIPGRNGMQVFQVHEEKGTYAWDLHDAATGKIIYKGGPEGVDNGRGMAAQLSATTKDWWFSSASERQQRSAATGEVASTANGSVNFRLYWDGSLQDALLDGSTLDKYDDANSKFNRLTTFYNLGPGSTCNGSKNTPNLSGDILGDWREELILYSVGDDETYLGVYSTNIETTYAVPTLMHDHTYRMAICWQNSAYNQPPHLGYNLAEEMAPHFVDAQMDIMATVGDSVKVVIQGANAKSIAITKSILPDGTSKFYNVPTGFTKVIDNTALTATIAGVPEMEGDYQIVLQLMGKDGKEKVVDTLVIHAIAPEPTIIMGDVNADKLIDVADVVGIVNYILGEPAEDFVEMAADVNGDGKIDIDDIVALVNIILDAKEE